MKLFALLLFSALTVYSQTPKVTHAQFETRNLSGDTAAELKKLIAAEAGPLWIGYAVEAQDRHFESCCWEHGVSGCPLETAGGHSSYNSQGQQHQHEESSILLVLLRVQNRVLDTVRPMSGACPLDAGGLRFVFVTGVSPSASVAFLSGQLDPSARTHQPDSLLATIALHAGNEAELALERLARPIEPEWLREKALFWLASARGGPGLAAVRNAAEHDPSPAIREKTMFDLSISKEPEAVGALMHFAKYDPDPRVRRQAIFWIATKAGDRAKSAIADAIANDPDIEVKKHAVFGLQQLPPDQGIPLLIQVARTNKNGEVRKQAIFWLGQSGDPRALAFFQEILGGS